MQVYEGMDIGTAKPSMSERRRVPHRLVDVLDLTESFDAARFVGLATRALAEIQGNRRVAVFCGGTGLYFQALMGGLGQAPARDPVLRATLEQAPLKELLQELAEKDAVTFARIDRKNPRRVIRAVEVIRLTGRPLSTQRADWKEAERPPPGLSWSRAFCLTRSSDEMAKRIEARVDSMFAQGLVAETERLLARGLDRNPAAMQAIGYRQVVDYLQGERSLAETIGLVKQRTRQFAKRQMTWFRRQGHWRFVQISPGEGAETIAKRLAALAFDETEAAPGQPRPWMPG
jgi:tRNA dimethylallyltransferase